MMKSSAKTLLLVAVVAGCTQSFKQPSSATQQTQSGGGASQESAISKAIAPEGEQSEFEDTLNAQHRAPITPTPQRYEVAKPAINRYSAKIPPVLLSEEHRSRCLVDIGESFPSFELPNGDGTQLQLADTLGEQATVVLLWTPDRWMSRAAISDLQRDVADQEGVRVITIAVGDNFDTDSKVTKAIAGGHQLLDRNGKTSDILGAGLLPRIYVLDAEGTIAWFDVEYSEATRRELQTALTALLSE
ncbi:TlpA family protein disulfide reductase [Adhaeretor mobilis]|uniref:AhpC/TSA family protein n=1 Tax=Adhaeretor mobilis TaxID=1930276 RepID=A0A517MS62_9BACT|nr:TlpA disulfide reductase family protein [Adhaeretor mobilis]QDS97715.1 AhpC/TSA family protein [Adhaeretor mobilis]